MKGYSFTERIYKLFSADEIRALKLLEMLEYTVIILLLVIGASFLINKYYYGFSDNTEEVVNEEEIENENDDKTRQNIYY